jgi:phosphate transport system substrate-binding protein
MRSAATLAIVLLATSAASGEPESRRDHPFEPDVIRLPSSAATIEGAGATFPYPVYAKWGKAFKQETGISVNYQSIGSGGGIKQIEANTVTFGASDVPVQPDELNGHGLVQFPTVMGAVVPVVNIDGIEANDLTLDGPTLAKIFLGEIKIWDDPAIKQLNPLVRLPSQAIVPIHRSDGSGTTFTFTHYLSEVSADWKSKVGANTVVEWPAGIAVHAMGGLQTIAQTRGAIGYTEYAYAKQSKLAYTKMINREGRTVAIGVETKRAAAMSADWMGSPGHAVILTDQPGASSWPITWATYVLMHKDIQKEAVAALKFFAWAYAKGDAMAEELDYAPMPPEVKRWIWTIWQTEMRSADGEKIFR